MARKDRLNVIGPPPPDPKGDSESTDKPNPRPGEKGDQKLDRVILDAVKEAIEASEATPRQFFVGSFEPTSGKIVKMHGTQISIQGGISQTPSGRSSKATLKANRALADFLAQSSESVTAAMLVRGKTGPRWIVRLEDGRMESVSV